MAKTYWLEGYEGPCKGGLYIRSQIALEVAEYEKRTGAKIVGLGLEDKGDDKPSWNLNLITEIKENK